MEYQYLDCMSYWKQRQNYYHGWAVKRINDDHIVVVRFLPSRYWLYVITVDRPKLGSPRGWALPLSNADGATQFYPEHATAYRSAADALDALSAMRTSPNQPVSAYLIEQGFTIAHACSAPSLEV